jgi:hypothetical protein
MRNKTGFVNDDYQLTTVSPQGPADQIDHLMKKKENAAVKQ